MKFIAAAGFVLVFFNFCLAIGTDSTESETAAVKQLKLEQMIGYTFGEKSSWTNISPELFLGFDTLIHSWNKRKNVLRFRFGPTVSASNIIIDTSNYLKALMLPGFSRLTFSLTTKHNIFKNRMKIAFSSGFELKMVGHNVQNGSILQNNLKGGAGIELNKLFSVSAEHTWAWHNLTNEAENAFTKTYKSPNTRARYLTLNLEGYSQAMDLFMVFSWRKLLNTNNFCTDANMNDKVLSIGLRKNLSLFNNPPKS